jgi:uncharacterized protein (DUF362 family)
MKVLLKPNLLAGDPPDAATTTHPAVVEAVLSRVCDLGARPLIGDSAAFGRTERIAEAAGIGAVARRFGVPIVDFRDRAVWVDHPGRTLRRLRMARDVLEADALINLPKLKVHRQMLLTAGVKNLYGCVPGKRKALQHVTHGDNRLRFARMVLDYVALIRPTLTLVDGIVAMERTGPRGGDPRSLGLLIAGTDPVAVDRVLCEVLGIPPDSLAFLPAAREAGLWETELARIRVCGAPIGDVVVRDFLLPALVPVTFSPPRLVRSALRDMWARRFASAGA